MSVSTSLSPLNTLEVDVTTDDQTLALTTDESYSLTVASPTSKLQAKTVFGALRGLETFSQLVDYDYKTFTYSIASTVISDYPRFAFRGTMIDTSRHYLTLQTIYQHLDAMAYSKFNVLHWHLVDDQSFPYQSEQYPGLSGEGAYSPNHIYTPADVQKVIAYARDRGIRVVPEFDTPGHTQSWGQGYPDLLTPCYSGGKPDGTRYAFNPIENTTYGFVYNFFKEVSRVFPDQYVHVGGDEVSFNCWQSNPEIQEFMASKGWKDYSLLEQYYETQLLAIVSSFGKEYIIWEDVFDNGVKVRPDTVVNVWRGGWQKTIEKSTAAGYKSILSSPWYLNYISYGSDWPTYYTVEPLDFSGTDEQKKLVMGGVTCLWAEYIDNTNLIPRAWPRACAISERLWSPSSVNDVKSATPRLEEHQCRLIVRGIPAEPPSGPSYCAQEYEPAYSPPWQN
eukprot:TRINITY_DN5718_c0_g1_i1.p1 TRINITY_DN5718_c0_g1~~TRINITY_DN5718_c0_g1_i1.p1  ORF type:complete len:524 (-),score=76.38 TRINITY_DN5718_c0_g1_i1:60-1406(-)